RLRRRKELNAEDAIDLQRPQVRPAREARNRIFFSENAARRRAKASAASATPLRTLRQKF
ncbi:MAG TPA: hypothetical protein VKB71_16525, partial [Rhizomicrobium sp.]|nr:hypothetical protein [Rhizomicrobium sp.]